MTMAVCFKCGALKFGAFCPCGQCLAAPETEEDLALSLAMTDHYFDVATLKQMGATVAAGTPPRLAPTTREDFLATIRGARLVAGLKELAKGKDHDGGTAKNGRGPEQ
jgi:hypothetical protein